MQYYLLQKGQLVAYVPLDASQDKRDQCERLRNREITGIDFGSGAVVDRCIGLIENDRIIQQQEPA